MKKKTYRRPMLTGFQDIEMIVPLAAAAAAESDTASPSSEAVSEQLAVKPKELRPDVSQVPALKKVSG